MALLPPADVPATPLNLFSGNATLTHYDLPLDYIASCGCVGRSTHYPTAAVNALVFGSNMSFGSACGTCYRLQLLSTPFSPLAPDGDGMQFAPNDPHAPTVVVKITDSCPMGGEWCSQTQTFVNATLAIATPNKLGSMIHFDLAWPSVAIPKTFYPLDSTHSDYGAWWAQYMQVDCKEWAGYNDAKAWGSDWLQQDAACCPIAPALATSDAHNTTVRVAQLVSGLPPSIDAAGQATKCPSYTAAQSNKSIAIPNTANELSRSSKSAATNSAMATTGPFDFTLLTSAFSHAQQALFAAANRSFVAER